MVITLLTLILLVGLLLLLIEIFIVPGIGLSGILGGALTICGIVVTYNHFGFTIALCVTLLLIVLFAISCVALSNSKLTEMMKLKSTIGASVEEDNHNGIAVGAKGKAVTRLNLYGKVEIDGTLYEAKALRYVEVNSSVEVTEIDSKYVVVRQID